MVFLRLPNAHLHLERYVPYIHIVNYIANSLQSMTYTWVATQYGTVGDFSKKFLSSFGHIREFVIFNFSGVLGH